VILGAGPVVIIYRKENANQGREKHLKIAGLGAVALLSVICRYFHSDVKETEVQHSRILANEPIYANSSSCRAYQLNHIRASPSQ